MGIILYELKKVCGVRYVRWCFLVFILLNAILCLYEVRMADGDIPTKTVADFYDVYTANQNRSDPANENAQPDLRAYLGGYSADRLISKVDAQTEYINGYTQKIGQIIDRASKNLNEYSVTGTDTDSYEYKYQLRIKDLYMVSKANTDIECEYGRGWDLLFNYQTSNLLILLFLIVVNSAIVISEYDTGMINITRSTRYGRHQTILAKIAASVTAACATVLFFTVENALIIHCETGFSSISNAIQIFDDFEFCPYILSVGEYLFIVLGIKALTFILFSTSILAIGTFLYNYVLLYLSGIVIVLVNTLMNTWDYIMPDNLLKISNLISASKVTPLFERYRALNIADNVIGYIPFIIAIFSIVILLMTVIATIRYSRSVGIVSWKQFSGITIRIKDKIGSPICKRSIGNRNYRYGIMSFELYKMLVSSKNIWLMIFMLILKCYIMDSTYTTGLSYSDAVYEEYMSTLAGKIDDEKREYIIRERSIINETLSKYNDINEAYLLNEIEFDEYRTYLQEYSYAYNRNEYFQAIEDHALYIDEMAEQGMEAWFVYDTGWKTLYFSSFDWSLYILLIILNAKVFSSEYECKSSNGSFAQILRITRYGRERTFGKKYTLSIILSCLLVLMWNLIEFMYISNIYDLPMLEAPVRSIEAFRDLSLDMSVFQYTLCFYFIKLFAAILLSIYICSLSEILQKAITVMTVTIVTTLLPNLLFDLGVTAMAYIDYISYMRATPMLLQNNQLFIYSIICILTCIVMMLRSRRTWVK